MIPYIQLPSLQLGPFTIHPFGVLVVIAVLVGVSLARRRARQQGLDTVRFESFLNWILLGGFLGAHVFGTLFYHPEEILMRPWSLLFIWEGLSSFGGFLGALLGALLWKRVRGQGQPFLPFTDAVLAVFPVAWIFGRAGCAVAHDHPGVRASAEKLLAVAFPDGPRYDLGLLEMFFAIVLTGVVALLWRRRLPAGAYVAILSLAYAPVRFFLDFLRVQGIEGADARYAGLTPAQWGSLLLFGFGLLMLGHLFRQRFSLPAEPAPSEKQEEPSTPSGSPEPRPIRSV